MWRSGAIKLLISASNLQSKRFVAGFQNIQTLPRVGSCTGFTNFSNLRLFTNTRLTRFKSTPNNETGHAPKWVPIWLYSSAALVFGIVVLGGLTRLTESGLSVTEWKPITGVWFPRSEEQWQQEFEKYKNTPEFQILNSDISLSDFKTIYCYEWAHRLWGRAIGVYFVLPALYLIARKKVTPRIRLYLLGSSALLGLQGSIGWWMVKSGLKVPADAQHPRVSHYRLATHLGTAFLLYLGILWTAFEVQAKPVQSASKQLKRLGNMVFGLGFLIFATAMSGALVAGLDAGMIYNEFPTMGHNRIIPPSSELFDIKYSTSSKDLIWRNLLENPVTVQLNHRLLATSSFTTMVAVCAYALLAKGKHLRKPIYRGFLAVSGFVTLQALLGYFTLIYLVPIPAAVLHQANAMATLTATLALYHKLRIPVNTRLLHQMTKPKTFNTQIRPFHTVAIRRHVCLPKVKSGQEIKITFVAPNGEKKTILAPPGYSILDVAHNNNIDIEGACEGSCACSTCHVIVDPEFYKKLEEPSDEENDMLDLAFGLQETSRLGCQVQLKKELDGLTVTLPSATRNMRVDSS